MKPDVPSCHGTHLRRGIESKMISHHSNPAGLVETIVLNWTRSPMEAQSAGVIARAPVYNNDRLSLCALVERTCRRKVLFKDDCRAVNNAFFQVRNAAVRMIGLHGSEAQRPRALCLATEYGI